MKKVLLTSTALVLSAGIASAEVSLGGTAGIWLSDDGETGSDPMVNYDLNLDFSASGETDGGLTMGLDFTIIDQNGESPNMEVDNSEVYISGAFGKLTVGDVDDALQKVAGLGDIGYDGIGVDNVAEFGRGAGSSGGVLYQYNAGDFGLYLSHNQDTGDDDVSVGVSAAFGDFKIGVGYEDANSSITAYGVSGVPGGITAVDLSGSFGDVGFDLFWIDHDLGTGYGATASMGFGATTVTLGYGHNDLAVDPAFGVGIEYDLGGATLAAGVGSVPNEANTDSVTKWDLGVSMSF